LVRLIEFSTHFYNFEYYQSYFLIMSIVWILSASLLGFAVASVFAGLLKLPRNQYLLVYIPLVAALFTLFIIINKISLKVILSYNWYWGVTGALLAGAFVIKNVYSQPASKKSTGLALLTDITWPGIVYGLIDALLFSVIPVLAVRIALSDLAWTQNLLGKICVGFIGLMASFFVTTACHLGYPEFRGKKVLWPNIGNGVLSLAYILTLNPLAAILPHMAMHVAAMIHGKETTGQVPPHYNK
jgi:hypothetical protein